MPYDEVDPAWSAQPTPPAWGDSLPPDEQWQQRAQTFEKSFDGFLPKQPDGKLQRHQHQRGRLQRTAPLKCNSQCRLQRPSRPSEVVLRNDLVGHDVQSWFRQLRRLQSYVAVIRAAKQTPAALTYRLELRHSNLHSPGFCGGFTSWWATHCADDAAALPWIPLTPPGLEVAASKRFHRFGSWHIRQRTTLLMTGIFQDLRKQPRDRLDFLHHTWDYGILAVEGHLLHLDTPVHMESFTSSNKKCTTLNPTVINEVTLDVGVNCQVGDVPSQHQAIADVPTLHSKWLADWRKTWCAMDQVPSEVWQRVTAFFAAYVPRLQLDVHALTLMDWTKAVRWRAF